MDSQIISEYGFLRLYAAIVIISKYKPIINKTKLEKELFKYYNDSKYEILFRNIYTKNNSSISLDISYNGACELGTFISIYDGSNDIKAIICYSTESAERIISQYTPEQIKLMNTLCSEINSIKEKPKLKFYAKKILE